MVNFRWQKTTPYRWNDALYGEQVDDDKTEWFATGRSDDMTQIKAIWFVVPNTKTQRSMINKMKKALEKVLGPIKK